MSKLYIDSAGELVDISCFADGDFAEPPRPQTQDDQWFFHETGYCRTLPTYFCPHCAREAMLGVDWSDPWL